MSRTAPEIMSYRQGLCEPWGRDIRWLQALLRQPTQHPCVMREGVNGARHEEEEQERQAVGGLSPQGGPCVPVPCMMWGPWAEDAPTAGKASLLGLLGGSVGETRI